ncbi:MAG: hypothetical protein RI964_1500 [Pseudomonadota bacterium]|jgi:hypothetical protein
MRLVSLQPHPSTPCAAVQALNVLLTAQTNGDWLLHYELCADLGALSIPAPQAPIATDGLWEHTCLEIFIGVQGETAYREFNFSPSTQWAAYAFRDYREQVEWSVSRVPSITLAPTYAGFILQTTISAADLPSNPMQQSWQIGLTAVIETATGEKSYWALHHPAEKPDFHHRGGFALSLPA